MKLTKLAQCMALIGLTAYVAAAEEGPKTDDKAAEKGQKIEITGSSIKRMAKEGALPVQVIKKEELERAGITSAEQLLATISANGSGAYNLSARQATSFVTSVAGHNMGASSANLRGLGPENTLVLLNGRRTATHGLNGSSVDLNSIPMEAVERVEVLKDGASAIYGTDAIGGVINFILKKDYRGFEAGAFADVTDEGGGNIYRASSVMGTGSLADDGYNLLLSISADKSTRLEGTQRSFQNGYQPERGLAPDTTGTAFANQAISYYLPGDTQRYTRANLLAFTGGCGSYPGLVPYPTKLWDTPSYGKACAYDYGGDVALMQPVKHVNVVSRGTFRLSDSTQLNVELTGARTTSTTQYSPEQFNSSYGFKYPAGGQYYQDLSPYIPGYDKTQDINIRWRCVECGPRREKTVADTYRALVSLDGQLGNWDYKVGLSRAGSKANTDLIDGYMNYQKFKDAIYTGKINPWLQPGQSQTAEGIALIQSAKVIGPQYGGRTSLTQLDGTVSGELWQLPAGPLAAAVGFDIRREDYQFAQTEASVQDIFDAGDEPALDKVERTTKAVFAELSIPIIKRLDAQLAVRHDRYSVVGGTTNPKLGLRYQPLNELLLRGSWNKGFHVPDYEALYGGEAPGTLNNPSADPVLCPLNPGNPDYCSEKWNTREGGNPNLKPERSRQWTAGIVIAPSNNVSASFDYWSITRTDRIASLPANTVLANYTTMGQYIIRKTDPASMVNGVGLIDYIRGGYINVAGDVTKGLDVNFNLGGKLGASKLNFSLDGSYLISHKSRLLASDPYVEYVGQFGDPNNALSDVYVRWKHMATFSWSQGPWGASLSQQFSSGYKDQLPLGEIPAGFDPNVRSYTLYNASANYTGIKNATLTVGVKNLFNTDPPFSAHNVDDVGGAGWDARVGQPRGRSFTVSLRYKFF